MSPDGTAQRHAFGQPMRRKEDLRLLLGQGRFIADELTPGTAHAVMIRSPHAHAAITAIDTASARAMPGVLAILTGADYAADGLGGITPGGPLIRLPGTPADQDFVFRPNHPALAQGRVRHVGETVAMIVADTPEQARDAAEAVLVEYDILPSVTDTAQTTQPGAPLVWDQAPGNACFRWQAGDASAVDAAFATAAHTVRLDTLNNRIHVASMETRGAIGEYTDGRYTLQTPTQMPHGLKEALATEVFRIPQDRIRVLVSDVGGSFGIKNALYPEQILVLWAAQKTGRRVAWIGERSDGFVSDYQARDNVYTAELALDAEYRFLALRVNSVAAIGAYLAPKGNLSPTANMPALAGVYRLPAVHVTVTGAFSHTAPTEVYRGAGRPEAVYLLERMVDHAAQELGVDRIALRRRNMLTPAEYPHRTALGLNYDSGDFPRMFDTAMDRADYAGFAAREAAAASRGLVRGIGWAHYCERVAGSWGENAWLELRPDGRITALLGSMSNGQGHQTAYAQLIADQLGVDFNDIEVIQGDTDRIPSGHGTGGSASIPISSVALREASNDLIAKATPLAADALEAAPVDVEFHDGAFRVVGTDRRVTLSVVAQKLPPDAMLGGTGAWKPDGPTFPNGCHVAEVQIDPETGYWTLERYTMLHDFGRVLNPMMLEGQLQGGVAQGIGQAAMERVVYDPDSGQVLSGSFMDYQIPRADELPPLVLETLPTNAPTHPLAIKGCGEAGAAGGAPAVMNALMDAIIAAGGGLLDMPATPERVWRALRNAS